MEIKDTTFQIDIASSYAQEAIENARKVFVDYLESDNNIKETHASLYPQYNRATREGDTPPPIEQWQIRTGVVPLWHDPVWVVPKKNEMRVTKRLSRHFLKEHGLKLPNELFEQAGNILAESKIEVKGEKVIIQHHIDGPREDYMHESSCWWSEFKESRDILIFNGGGAIRVYDNNERLISRVWFMPYNDGNHILLFNAYGKYEIPAIARIVAEHLGSKFTITKNWKYSHELGHRMYLNDGRIAILYNEDAHAPNVDEQYNIISMRPDKWKYIDTFKCYITEEDTPMGEADYIEDSTGTRRKVSYYGLRQATNEQLIERVGLVHAYVMHESRDNARLMKNHIEHYERTKDDIFTLHDGMNVYPVTDRNVHKSKYGFYFYTTSEALIKGLT